MQGLKTQAIEQNIPEHVLGEMDDIVSIIGNRVRDMIVAAVNDIIVRRVVMAVGTITSVGCQRTREPIQLY